MEGSRFQRLIAILGHPTTPDVRWTPERLAAIRDVGFDTIQMSIAWASKPANEVLNLEDLDDPSNRAEWQRRAEMAKAVGLRTLAHFGIPKGFSAEEPQCILDPAVSEEYCGRLARLFIDFPGIDEVMIYTYDQLAWLCSEFGDCPRCHGVPLHERLTPFLEALVDAVQSARPGARLWWEPWELSAGQTFAIAERIRPSNFGLILHHTIAEVEFVNQTDLWLRNLARLASRRGIPVLGECFLGGAGEDIDPATHLPCPRLVYQQLEALRRTEGVVGAKEYYGLVPEDFSVNIGMVRAYLRAPGAPLGDLITEVAEGYPMSAREPLTDAWEMVATAMELFPWDASWLLRRIFDGTRSGDGTRIQGASWMTPSWQSNRRGFYLVTDEERQHPWMREDVGLRAVMAARTFAEAASLLEAALPLAGGMSPDVSRQCEDVGLAAEVSRSYGQALLDHLHDETS